ncbi:MAG: sulfite exporter TauE/SafE family protein [Halocynthiibacter sp.]
MDVVVLLLAGFLAGAVNAVAGGGTFFTFGAMSFLGIGPIVANATSAIAVFPGYISSTLSYWSDIKSMWRGALVYALISGVGAVIGSLLLLQLDSDGFAVLVPWLLLGATAVFALGPWIKKRQMKDVPMGIGRAVQFITSIYGGFFGAGMGVMMLASLGITERGDYHRVNALKNLLSIVIASVAIIVFTWGGVIDWRAAVMLVPTTALGGVAGVWIARRVPEAIMRYVVIAVGVFLAVYYFTK